MAVPGYRDPGVRKFFAGSQDQRSELGIVKAHWVFFFFWLIFGSFPPGFKANCLWNIPAYLRGARG